MRWDETIASRCRYGDIIGKVFDGCDVIWEHSEDDYQGTANVLLQMPDGRYGHYCWTYGSCSGCDEWEANRFTDKQIQEEVKKTTAWLKDKETLLRYLHLEDEFENAKLPIANSPTNGSIPGMMKYLFGGWGKDFESMRKTVLEKFGREGE